MTMKNHNGSLNSTLGIMPGEDTLLVFGSQALPFSLGIFKELLSSVWNTPEQVWISEVVASLPDCWDAFVRAFPKFAVVDPNARQMLVEMHKWFQDGAIPAVINLQPRSTGSESRSDWELPNIILSPLVVIAQLVECVQFLDTATASGTPPRKKGTLGFCTGFLSAVAVALGDHKSQIRSYGATSVRLAMLIGAMVDAQEMLDVAGPARALATAWTTGRVGEDELQRILKHVPGSYISVAYDESRATVTTAASTAAQLEQRLRSAGFKVSEIGLHGRFHHDWYREDIEAVIRYCDKTPAVCFPDASSLVHPTWSNAGTIISQGSLHGHAIRAILVNKVEWERSFSAACAAMTDPATFKIFWSGPERNVPASALRALGSARVLRMAEVPRPETSPRTYEEDLPPQARKEDDVAVIGMSIKVAGADDVDDFWDILCQGLSQHREVPADRLSFENVWREADTTDRKWYGNFINDHDAFDHRFFKKTPREMSSTDPQQRHMLQVAYQAVEQSGYFVHDDNTATTTKSRGAAGDKKIGCFIGVCSADYENNAACHAPNAFTAVGNLKSFIAGKISHFFGWLGPSLCIDSACSSSLVAIHQACRAVISGECSAALAGGANIMTNSLWFENLAAASFLSPSGQCKPFDADADGYCRGEGFAAVMVKKMSNALADGDIILGTISATSVMQNQNCTPVFVPNSPSLSDLFRQVLDQAKLSPRQITVVEAHGTGTQVGDPAEYSSIREVLGSSARLREDDNTDETNLSLALGSVKGLVGHTECSSGAVSLVKTLLMAQNKLIPPQVSFNTINPAILTSPGDNMEIVTKLRPWVAEGDFHASLINNYGASGSNASMVVTEAPKRSSRKRQAEKKGHDEMEYPFRIFGYDERALKAYCERLKRFLVSKRGNELSVADLSFNISRQTNPTLSRMLIFSCGSIDRLVESLDATQSTDSTSSTAGINSNAQVVSRINSESQTPVVLCFGGQISTFIGLDHEIYNSNKIMRKHLHECDDVLRATSNIGSFFPAIFQFTPVEDTVQLQTMLFAMQYACAMSWIACGIAPVALVGHSFGELTALCVSGVVSLQDAIKLVAGRAAVIRDFWGKEKGAMMAVEGDFDAVEALIAETKGTTNIACFNGARSFTLAGTVAEIDEVARLLDSRPAGQLKSKRLNVTNAFHSALVEPLIPQLVALGQEISFNEPKIPLETATESPLTGFSTHYIANHLRRPVYFNHALQRLARKYPSAIFLEAGSNSTVTIMASRALSSKGAGANTNLKFQGLDITSSGRRSKDSKGRQAALAQATLSLWKHGLRTLIFWPHHREQTYEYAPIVLPPYQFEKTRHWLNMKAPPRIALQAETPAFSVEKTLPPPGLFSLLEAKEKCSARFRINTMGDKYRDLVSGHRIARTAAICPATVIVQMAIDALTSVEPELSPVKWLPRIHDVSNQAAICIDDSRVVMLDYEAIDSKTNSRVWNWRIASFIPGPGLASGGTREILHATGQLVFIAADDSKTIAEFRRYERLTGHQHCTDILLGDHGASTDDDSIQVIHGERNIYRAFSDVVDYATPYQGLRRLVGRGNESAGRVVKKHGGETFLDAHLADCFSQVGGIWVNCMTDCSAEDMYIATGFEQWAMSPELVAGDYVQSEAWDVLARHEKTSDGKGFFSDIFVFNATSGKLTEVILGINYHRVSKASMAKTLARLTPGLSSSSSTSGAAVAVALTTIRTHNLTNGTSNNDPSHDAVIKLPAYVESVPNNEKAVADEKRKAASDMFAEVENTIRLILADISGLEPAEITTNSWLADIGIDSLMAMELGHELESAFKRPLMSNELAAVETFEALVVHIASVLGVPVEAFFNGNNADDDRGSSNSTSSGEPTTLLTITPASSTDIIETKEIMMKYFDSTSDSTINSESESRLSPSILFSAFEESKRLTDNFIEEHRCASYVDTVLPRQTQLCIALAVDAFEELGCPLRSARAGEILPRIPHRPEHARLTDWLYQMLAHEARLLHISGTESDIEVIITRTAVPAPTKRSNDILSDLLRTYPDHEWANRLTYFAGKRLAEVLCGDIDGIKLIFGTDEGRELVTGLYGDSLLNKLANVQMRDIITRLVDKSTAGPQGFKGPLKIMELGAGTGGTTRGMLPMLAKLGVPVEYTFTDLSGSFVAAARKTFGKEYSWMKFRVHDIENPPAAELLGSQHIVIASNAIHATHNLGVSVANIRKALRPDGFLMMLEMTEPVFWVDMIFGLFEGWWLFDDGRKHAIAHQTRWEADLHSAGYGRVDWTDGWRPECKIQRVIVAQASATPGFSLEPTKIHFTPPVTPISVESLASIEATRVQLEEYVTRYTRGFNVPVTNGVPFCSPEYSNGIETRLNVDGNDKGLCVAITGATGSLGAHLVARLASLPAVKTIFCLNRHSHSYSDKPHDRQTEALRNRHLHLTADESAKLRVLVVDSAKPQLGLDMASYRALVENLTHITHNAWPMSGKRPVAGFEAQFAFLRSLIDLARDISIYRNQLPVTSSGHDTTPHVAFQFISSIAVMGHHPLIKDNSRFAPEERATIPQLLPNGYAHAKWVCERMIDETLHRYPKLFRAMAVRPGQIAGSSITGYWNEAEHFSFLIKSSQTLGVLPDLHAEDAGSDGASWTPVDAVAGTLTDLVLRLDDDNGASGTYPIYHIDNPVRQPWNSVLQVLARELKIARENIIPFQEWVGRVRRFPGSVQDNPASMLIDFLDVNFVRMSCGGMLLDTARSCEHSNTMRSVGPVSPEVVKKYIDWWKAAGILHS